MDCKVALLRAQDRILGGLGHTEFHDPLGLDLDCFAGRWIASLACLAIHQHQFAQARQGEAVLRVLVSQLHNGLDDLGRLLLGEVVLGGDFSSDLGFSQSFGHNRLLGFCGGLRVQINDHTNAIDKQKRGLFTEVDDNQPSIATTP